MEEFKGIDQTKVDRAVAVILRQAYHAGKEEGRHGSKAKAVLQLGSREMQVLADVVSIVEEKFNLGEAVLPNDWTAARWRSITAKVDKAAKRSAPRTPPSPPEKVVVTTNVCPRCESGERAAGFGPKTRRMVPLSAPQMTLVMDLLRRYIDHGENLDVESVDTARSALDSLVQAAMLQQ